MSDNRYMNACISGNRAPTKKVKVSGNSMEPRLTVSKERTQKFEGKMTGKNYGTDPPKNTVKSPIMSDNEAKFSRKLAKQRLTKEENIKGQLNDLLKTEESRRQRSNERSDILTKVKDAIERLEKEKINAEKRRSHYSQIAKKQKISTRKLLESILYEHMVSPQYLEKVMKIRDHVESKWILNSVTTTHTLEEIGVPECLQLDSTGTVKVTWGSIDDHSIIPNESIKDSITTDEEESSDTDIVTCLYAGTQGQENDSTLANNEQQNEPNNEPNEAKYNESDDEIPGTDQSDGNNSENVIPETQISEDDKASLQDLHDMCNQDFDHLMYDATPAEKLRQRKLYLMHCRLGHRNFDYIRKNFKLKGKTTPCDACLVMKSTRQNINRNPSERAKEPTERLHLDTQPLMVKTHKGWKYALLTIDCYSGYMWSSLCKAKSDVLDALYTVIRVIERQTGKHIKKIRCDGGTEFMGLNKWCKQNGVQLEISAPYCQFQNGVIERHTRTVLDSMRTMLYHAGLPRMFWGEAIQYAVWIHNITVKNKEGKTPVEAFYQANLPKWAETSNLRTFGCLTYAHKYKEQRASTKFSDRAYRGIYLGFAPNYRCHKIYDLDAKKCRAVLDIRTIETILPWKSKLTLFDSAQKRGENYLLFEEDTGIPMFQKGTNTSRGQYDTTNNGTVDLQEEEIFKDEKEEIFNSTQYSENENDEDINDDTPEPFARNLDHSFENTFIDGVFNERINDMQDSFDPDISWIQEEDEQSIYDQNYQDWKVEVNNDDSLADIKNALHEEYVDALVHAVSGKYTKDLIQKEFNYMCTILDKNKFVIFKDKKNAKNRNSLRSFNQDMYKEKLNGKRKRITIESYVTEAKDIIEGLTQDDSEPKNYKQAMQSEEWNQWDKAMTEEMISLVSKGTWEVIEKKSLPKNRKALRNMWIYKKKKDKHGNVSRYKARLVIKGYSQIPGQDFTETFASVAKFNTIRLLIALAAEFKWNMTQMDVKTAFLNGDLDEEIYMRPPEGYPSDSLLKLRKGLYGLKQAPRQWNKKLVTFLKKLGFNQCSSDECLFVLRKGKNILFMAVYVDDLIMADNNNALREEVADALKEEYEMDDIGRLEWFLGIKVEYTKEGIWLKQDAYIDVVAKRFNLENSKEENLPSTPSMQLSKEDCPTKTVDKLAMSTVPYNSAVGSILYASGGTMVQVAAPTGQVCRYMHNPGRSHWKATQRIIKYLKTHKNRGLFYKYGTGKHIKLVGYCDSDYNSDKDDRISTTGYVFKINGRTITWNSKKQASTALSTSEAEYMALCEAAKEAVWLRRILEELGFPQDTTTIYEDNMGAVLFTRNNVNHKRNKHIDIRYHYTRQLVEKGDISVRYLPTQYMIADLLTKSPSKQQFQNLVDYLCGTRMIEEEVTYDDPEEAYFKSHHQDQE